MKKPPDRRGSALSLVEADGNASAMNSGGIDGRSGSIVSANSGSKDELLPG
jgi:hypothetical protein